MTTEYNVALSKASDRGDQQFEKLANIIKREFIDKGKLGKGVGEGFYKYPNPNFMNPNFLEG